MTSEKFCLKWNDFQENIADSFHGLREDLAFSDVTLVCQDDKHIEAHRVILSACSPFFSSLLKRNKHSHPMIYMRGLKSKNLVAIVDFIYHGEANIYQEDLDDFLALAEELQLKGLTGANKNQPIKQNTLPDIKIGKEDSYLQNNMLHHQNSMKNKTVTKQYSQPYSNEQITSIAQNVEYKTDTFENNVPIESSRIVANVDPDNEDLQVKIASMMESVNDGESNKWRCTVCGKTAKLKGDVRRHVESHIGGVTHPCHMCGKISRSSNALIMHFSKYHRL